jgi:hypothetical protein
VKILISLSNAELHAIEYTGTNGLYSAVTPMPEFKKNIMNVAKYFGFNTDENALHCTVMYSKESQPALGKVSCDPKRVYTANVVGIQYWDGHDKKGYFTLKLQCPELSEEHNRLKKLGCTPTFDEYSPHITLWAGQTLTPYLKKKMAIYNRKPGFSIGLTNQFVGDVKDD